MTELRPRIGVILGSGLGDFGSDLQRPTVIAYVRIPGFPSSSVPGHANELAIGNLSSQPVAVMRGRGHFYEGLSAAEVGFPVRVLAALGISTLIVTNAAGALNQSFARGELMLISDHIFLPGMSGHHPLRGPNDDARGPRFPDMSQAYDSGLRQIAHRLAQEQNIVLREGIYAMVSGPSYETPAETRFLRTMGADAVGMSTVPEVVVARHLGIRVLGISLITNVISGAPITHEEVLATADAARPRLERLIRSTVEALAETKPATDS